MSTQVRQSIHMRKKDRQVSVRLPSDLEDVLKRLADQDSRSLSSMIEIALCDYVERHGSKPAGKRK
jgi:predicted transcriptional regulator